MKERNRGVGGGGDVLWEEGKREMWIFHERKKEIFNEQEGGRKREGLLWQREVGGSVKKRHAHM